MSARSDGAVTFTMKTSRSTMKTGAKSTGSSQGLRRAGLGTGCVSFICEFNEDPLWSVRLVWVVSLAI